MNTRNPNGAKPFLKWAGGKSQLLSQFRKFYPLELKQGKIKKYIEPFLGSGAVFFDVVKNYQIQSVYLYDINVELIVAYRVIQKKPAALMELLNKLSGRYKSFGEAERKQFYYEVRDRYNSERTEVNYKRFSDKWLVRTAQMIFLNKTCYNGLFRLNRNGEFNVPFGSYKNPRILDEDNILKVSQALQIAQIQSADFEACDDIADAQSFVYFDPPYRPLNQTSNFTSYSQFEFGDEEQKRLSRFYACLDKKNRAKVMLSNSDPTNENPKDRFFNGLYQGYHIHKVSANRMINSNAKKRGQINELLITNY
ncbi:MAG: DNA adenine methylase [bacterium]